MSIVKAQCTNCGAEFPVDNSKEGAICPFCNTPYIVEKAMDHNDTTNYVVANNKNVIDEANKDFEIVAGTLVKYVGSSTDVVIPNNVVIIGEKAFYGCGALNSVIIPAGVIKIGESAFYNCFSLKSVTIPNGVFSIEAQAFKYCSGLTTITIPDSVSEIGREAFLACSSLKSVIIGKNLRVMGANAFADCVSLENVHFPPEKEILTNTWEKWANNTKWCEKYKIEKSTSERNEKKKKKIIVIAISVVLLICCIVAIKPLDNSDSTQNLEVFEYLLTCPSIKEVNAKIGEYSNYYIHDFSTVANNFDWLKNYKRYDKTYTYDLTVCGYSGKLYAYRQSNYSDTEEYSDGKDLSWNYSISSRNAEKFEKKIIDYFNKKLGNNQVDTLSNYKDCNVYSWLSKSTYHKLYFVIENPGSYCLIVE